MIRHLVGLCHELKVATVAEMVEVARRGGCAAQGRRRLRARLALWASRPPSRKASSRKGPALPAAAPSSRWAGRASTAKACCGGPPRRAFWPSREARRGRRMVKSRGSRVAAIAAGALMATMAAGPALADCYDVVGCTDKNAFSANYGYLASLANGPSCDFLYMMRNRIYAQHGYCFKTARVGSGDWQCGLLYRRPVRRALEQYRAQQYRHHTEGRERQGLPALRAEAVADLCGTSHAVDGAGELDVATGQLICPRPPGDYRRSARQET